MRKMKATALACILGVMMVPAPCFAQNEEAQAAKSTEGMVAESNEMAPQNEISDEGLTPVTGEEIADGTYDIEVECSSSMFPIDECQLTVKDGQMSAVLTMGGQGYEKLYMGTGEEAAAASEEDYILYAEAEDGRQTYELPLEALDKEVNCAAFSKRKQKWYDRTLIFKASSLPAEALKNVQILTVADLGLEDGDYTVEAVIEGGSGHTKIESPMALTIKDGQAEATLVFGNSNYDYVIVGETKCEWDGSGDASTFTIPVTGFDYKMPIIADTTALGTPKEMDYTLTFDSASIAKAE